MNPEELIEDRAKTHGSYSQVAYLSRGLKLFFVDSTLNAGKLTHEESEALAMIFHKIARIGAGDPHYVDHWADIAGYATLVVLALKTEAPK
jgi:hypothetical protein